MGQIKKKKALSGFIQPRWPKERIVRWLEIGAIPAVVGLWFPDWVGTYFGEDAFAIPPSLPYLPPFLTFIGALILLKACYEGILHMGYHFKGLIVSGVIAVAAAAASVAFWLAGVSVASLVMVGVAAFFAGGFIWFTIGKVWEITQEKRAHITWHLILIGDVIFLAVFLAGVILSLSDPVSGAVLVRIGVALFTVTFAVCRYGVYCYKTQTSIGARFSQSPDEQYWTVAQ